MRLRIVFLLFALLLAACGEGDTSNTNPTAPANGAGGGDVVATEPADNSSSDSPTVTLVNEDDNTAATVTPVNDGSGGNATVTPVSDDGSTNATVTPVSEDSGPRATPTTDDSEMPLGNN
jgi:hypothetical protein